MCSASYNSVYDNHTVSQLTGHSHCLTHTWQGICSTFVLMAVGGPLGVVLLGVCFLGGGIIDIYMRRGSFRGVVLLGVSLCPFD